MLIKTLITFTFLILFACGGSDEGGSENSNVNNNHEPDALKIEESEPEESEPEESIPDLKAPSISLIGNPNITINQGDIFTDPGVIAYDDVDGDITNRVITNNNLLIDTPGTYLLSYDVTDSAGNKAETKQRLITVINQGPVVIGVLKRVVDSNGEPIRTSAEQLCGIDGFRSNIVSGDGRKLIVCANSPNIPGYDGIPKLALISLDNEYVVQNAKYITDQYITYASINQEGTKVLVRTSDHAIYYDPISGNRISKHETNGSNCGWYTYDPSLRYCISNTNPYRVYDILSGSFVKTLNTGITPQAYVNWIGLDENRNGWYSSSVEDIDAGDTSGGTSIFSTNGNYPVLRSYDIDGDQLECEISFSRFNGGTLYYTCLGTDLYYTTQPEASRWNLIKGRLGWIEGISHNGRYFYFKGSSNGDIEIIDKSIFGDDGYFLVDAFSGELVAGPAISRDYIYGNWGHDQVTDDGTLFFDTINKFDPLDDNSLRELYVWDYDGTP